MDYKIEGPYFEKAAVCAPILRALPAWFGIEEAVRNYITDIDHLPTLLAYRGNSIVGFTSLKLHTPYSGEIYVMGVLPEAHRQGIGRMLIQRAEVWLQKRQVEYLQVKTLGPSHNDEGYASTRAFYTALGFRPLEEFKQIWDEHNPCLIMVKRL